MMTKNKLITLLAILFVSHAAIGQDEDKSGTAVEFGLHHSLNFTHLNGTAKVEFFNRTEELVPLRNRTTFDIGMFAILHMNKVIAIQPEVVYTYMGAHFQKRTTIYHDLGSFGGTDNETYALRYIKGALVTNLKFNEKVFIQFGGYASSLLSAEKNPWWTNALTESEPIDNANSYDAGLIGGLGFSTKIVNFTFRYNYGMVDIINDIDNEIDLSNGVLQFVIQWKFYSDLK